MKNPLAACSVMIKIALVTIGKGISTFQIWPSGGYDVDVEQRPPMRYWPAAHTKRSYSQSDRVQGQEQPQPSPGDFPARALGKGRRSR